MRRIVGADHRFQQQYLALLLAGRGQGVKAVAQNGGALLVVPIVDDVLHDVGVAAGGHGFEEIGDFGAAAIFQAQRADALLRAGNNFREIAENAFHRWIFLQDGGQHHAVSAGHIYQRANAGKIVGLERGVDHHLAEVGHGGMEQRALFRLAGEIFKDGLAQNALRQRFTGLHRVHELRPYLVVERIGEVQDKIAQRAALVFA